MVFDDRLQRIAALKLFSTAILVLAAQAACTSPSFASDPADLGTQHNLASGLGPTKVVTAKVGPFSKPAILVIHAVGRASVDAKSPLLSLEIDGNKVTHSASSFGDGVVANDVIVGESLRMQAGQVVHLRASVEATPGLWTGIIASAIDLFATATEAP
jgi:hypothetical protein